MKKISEIFSANLSALRGSTSKSAFARSIGVDSPTTYQRMEEGRIPDQEKLSQIAEKIGCQPADLITEDGWKTILYQKSRTFSGDKTNVRPAPAIKTRRVPVISWAMAGVYLDRVAGNFGDLELQIDEELDVRTNDENAYALIVEGDSMEPYILAGSRIVAAPNVEARNGDLVVARLAESGEVRFKRIRFTGPEGSIVRLESLNPLYPILEYERKEFRLIHPVIEWQTNPRAVHFNYASLSPIVPSIKGEEAQNILNEHKHNRDSNNPKG